MADFDLIGENIAGFIIQEYIGGGQIGEVYKAYNDTTKITRAIKFIPYASLRVGWENEIIKANQLVEHDNVVQYYNHERITIRDQEYLYITWHYINGKSIKSIIEKRELTIEVLCNVVKCILSVLHACSVMNIVHADLHSGNVLIQDRNLIGLDSSFRKIWVTDFGYLTQTADKEYLDDFVGLNRIIKDALQSINFNAEDGPSKKLYRYFKNDFSKLLLESDPTQGEYVRNAKILHDHLNEYIINARSITANISWNIGDFLAAEHLGDSFDEWRALFVPRFIAINELLERNICVLTGLRGCGKTTLFRRLTAYFNLKLGDSAIEGSDQFLGFYVNARNISEAFPWLPDYKEGEARSQVIHFFHLSCTIEILEWLNEESIKNTINLMFLNNYFKIYFPDFFTSDNLYSIPYLLRLLKSELDKSRLRSLYHEDILWQFSHYNYLDEFVQLLCYNLPTHNKPFYFFFDDYSTPMVKESLQRILNPIIFRRSAYVIFKVSTESVESFVPVGLNGKALEENDDYKLIDCGALLLSRDTTENFELLSAVLQPRIERHELLKDRQLNIKSILGETKDNNNARADKIKKGDKENLYQGWKVFSSIWSSDIREMINLFASMVYAETDENLQKYSVPLITNAVQNNVYRASGGQFIGLLAAAPNPTASNLNNDSTHTYGKHLADIVNTFHDVALHAIKNTQVKNQDRLLIKQARRIEITNDVSALPDDVKDYYKGLLRYGIFIRDFRGKSVRGQVVPRLVLRGTLIPYFTLTFSKHDSISMTWDEFIMFLRTPQQFASMYKGRRPEVDGQLEINEEGYGNA